MFKTQPKLKKKMKSGYLSFNFSPSFDLVYKYLEFNTSCLTNKSMKMLMMVSRLLLTLQRALPWRKVLRHRGGESRETVELHMCM